MGKTLLFVNHVGDFTNLFYREVISFILLGKCQGIYLNLSPMVKSYILSSSK